MIVMEGHALIGGSAEGRAFPSERADREGLRDSRILYGGMPSVTTILRCRTRIAGIVLTEPQGAASHACVILRELQIPVVQLKGESGICEGMPLRIDGDHVACREQKEAAVLPGVSEKAVTRDGHSVELYATARDVTGIREAIRMGVAGVGIFYTDGMRLGGIPAAEVQYRIYADAVRKSAGKPISICLFDLISGVYADYTEIYETQLLALCRAAAGGTLQVLVPNVNYRAQITEIKKIAARMAEKLHAQNLPCGHLRIGAVIGNMMGAAVSEDICAAADFAVVDLAGIAHIEENFPLCYESYNRMAVLRICRLVLDNAARAGRPITVSGDLLCDSEMLRDLVGLGVQRISSSAHSLPHIAACLAGESYSDAQRSSAHHVGRFFFPVDCCAG